MTENLFVSPCELVCVIAMLLPYSLSYGVWSGFKRAYIYNVIMIGGADSFDYCTYYKINRKRAGPQFDYTKVRLEKSEK